MNHVMLVDDDTDLLRLLSMRLGAAGYRVTAVESAEDALARFLRGRRGLPAAVAPADHGDIDVRAQDLDVRAGRRAGEIRARDGGQWWQAVDGMALDGEAGQRPLLACPDVGHPVYLREAVAAVARQAQRARSGWRRPGT